MAKPLPDPTMNRETIFALLRTPTDLRKTLLRLAESEEPYFTLTGSAPDAPGGCCPSDAVGAAEALVKAGLLEAVRPPPSGEAECPVTLYAFAGEVRPGKTPDRPRFVANRPLRLWMTAMLKA
jgi:hypothetical protein